MESDYVTVVGVGFGKDVVSAKVSGYGFRALNEVVVRSATIAFEGL